MKESQTDKAPQIITGEVDRPSSYEAVKYNALKHGILSAQTVLPHEDRDEYDSLLDSLIEEHQPKGATEAHLVEDLAGVMWRKRRVLLAEGARINRNLQYTVGRLNDKISRTVESAVPFDSALGSAYFDYEDMMSVKPEELKRLEKEAVEDLEATERAYEILRQDDDGAYELALKALKESSLEWWEESLEEGERDATAESLLNFVIVDLLRYCRSCVAEYRHNEAIKRQVFGESVESRNMENLSRYETHLDRKFQRTLAMLLKLRELRGGNN